jgi:hypothetical protein
MSKAELMEVQWLSAGFILSLFSVFFGVVSAFQLQEEVLRPPKRWQLLVGASDPSFSGIPAVKECQLSWSRKLGWNPKPDGRIEDGAVGMTPEKTTRKT